MTPPMTSWLPPRARRVLSARIARRNTLDRALAVARGLDPASPQCARFQSEHYRDALDRVVCQRAVAVVS